MRYEKFEPVVYIESHNTGLFQEAHRMSTRRKSSYSATGSECVEVGHGIGIRDSKAPASHLPVSREAWDAFLRYSLSAQTRP